MRRKHLVKTIPKTVASVSLFAQLPSDFRIGRIDTWGLLKLLVAFHREVSSGESDVINCSKVAFRAFLKAVVDGAITLVSRSLPPTASSSFFGN